MQTWTIDIICNLGYGCLNWHSSLTCFFFLKRQDWYHEISSTSKKCCWLVVYAEQKVKSQDIYWSLWWAAAKHYCAEVLHISALLLASLCPLLLFLALSLTLLYRMIFSHWQRKGLGTTYVQHVKVMIWHFVSNSHKAFHHCTHGCV
jgi:hypothetical protein